MAGGNNSLNRIAGSGQSRVIRAGESFSGPVANFVPREDTVIADLEETVVFNGVASVVDVIGSTTTLPNTKTVSGQNISGLTLKAGEIYVPRFACFTKVQVTTGSVLAYLLLPSKDIDRKLDDNI